MSPRGAWRHADIPDACGHRLIWSAKASMSCDASVRRRNDIGDDAHFDYGYYKLRPGSEVTSDVYICICNKSVLFLYRLSVVLFRSASFACDLCTPRTAPAVGVSHHHRSVHIAVGVETVFCAFSKADSRIVLHSTRGKTHKRDAGICKMIDSFFVQSIDCVGSH